MSHLHNCHYRYTLILALSNTAIPSYLIFRIIVWSCLLRKNGGRRPSLAAIFPHKAAPHTSLSHYNAKYQITRNSRIDIFVDFSSVVSGLLDGTDMYICNNTSLHTGLSPQQKS